jgi:hypothetical protein
MLVRSTRKFNAKMQRCKGRKEKQKQPYFSSQPACFAGIIPD